MVQILVKIAVNILKLKVFLAAQTINSKYNNMRNKILLFKRKHMIMISKF